MRKRTLVFLIGLFFILSIFSIFNVSALTCPTANVIPSDNPVTPIISKVLPSGNVGTSYNQVFGTVVAPTTISVVKVA